MVVMGPWAVLTGSWHDGVAETNFLSPLVRSWLAVWIVKLGVCSLEALGVVMERPRV